jgi:predicted CXXCH cytochrome family protein
MPGHGALEIPGMMGLNRWTSLLAASVAGLIFPLLAVGKSAAPTPLPWGAEMGSTHAPYESGECSACHDKPGPFPGKPAQSGDDLCLSCHADVQIHAHAFRHCSRCHNAHNAVEKKLLRATMDECRSCHSVT